MSVTDKRALESEILTGPAPTTTTARIIDFGQTEVHEYDGYFAMVIDDVLTSEECAQLLSLIQPSEGAPWPPATVTTYDGRQLLVPDSRHCGRIVFSWETVATRLLGRIRHHIPPGVATLDTAPDITGQIPVICRERWEISRLNEALRFLKYEAGDYFRPHCDAHYVDKETGETSYLTAHFYLNGGSDGEAGVEGGATRFAVRYDESDQRKVDIDPKVGSVLIFQQRDLYHEGADVTRGTKYTMRADVMYKKA